MTDQTPPASELERAYLEPEPFQLQDEVTSLTRDLSASAGLFQRSLDMIGRLQEENARLSAGLARVEAEAGRLAEAGLAAHVKATSAQTQLADVLYILDQHRTWTGMGWEQLPVPVHAVEKIRSKLAQAEQQEARGAQAGEFQREDRYIVIKRKDLDQLPMEMRLLFSMALNELAPRLPNREYLVIESDWPEFEPTWAAIQARVTGQGAQAGDFWTWLDLAYRDGSKGSGQNFTKYNMEVAYCAGAESAQAKQGAQAGDERAAFESWFTEKAKTLPLLRGESVLRYHKGEGQYVSDWALFGYMVWKARAALATQPAVPVSAETMSFEYAHISGERRTVSITREDVIEGMEDALYEKLSDQICRCEPIGETNVVECNCQDYIEEFALVSAKPAVRGAEQ